MFIPVSYGKVYEFSVTALRRAELICPHCGTAFALTDQVGAVGESFGILGLRNAKAADVAYARGLDALQSSAQRLSPALCPQCHQFHPAMQPLLDWLHRQRILFVALGLALTAGVAGLGIYLDLGTTPAALGLLLLLGLPPMVLLVHRFYKDLRLHPVNVEPLPKEPGRPACRIGLRFHPDQDWHWLGGAEFPT